LNNFCGKQNELNIAKTKSKQQNSKSTSAVELIREDVKQFNDTLDSMRKHNELLSEDISKFSENVNQYKESLNKELSIHTESNLEKFNQIHNNIMEVLSLKTFSYSTDQNDKRIKVNESIQNSHTEELRNIDIEHQTLKKNVESECLLSENDKSLF
jgi:hypothetical protein